MSIFKESFKTFVRDQIKIRQKKVSSNDRTYSLQRQCTIRMASGVNVNGNSNLAMNNVLQGGTLSPLTVEATQTTNETNTPEFALKNRGGFDEAYDSPSDGFGYVPMPGITNVNIKTKTAYGSLRGATVNFECHNLNQLSNLEQLYMRPGYPCLLEWGWLPFIDNNGDQQTRMNFLSDDGQFFNVEGDPNHFVKREKGDLNIQDGLQRLIREKKIKNAGNYDGLYGIVKNFNYKVRPDGGFTCMTELVALGEILDSLRGVISDNDTTKHSLEDILLNLNDYAEAITYGDLRADLPEDEIEPDPDNSNETRSSRTKKAEEILTTLKELGVKKSDLFILNEDPFYDRNGADLYINWGILSKIIENCVDKDDSGEPIIKIVTKDSGKFTTNRTKLIKSELEFNTNEYPNFLDKLIQKPYGVEGTCTNLDVSINPKICLFPSQIYDIFGDIHDTGKQMFMGNQYNAAEELVGYEDYEESSETLSVTETNLYNDVNVEGSTQITNTSSNTSLQSSKNIKDIYFNTSYLFKVFKSQYYIKDEDGNDIENESFSIGKYIKTIWDDVNASCGNSHNFQLITEFDNGRKCKIVDLEVKTDLKSDDLAKINVLSTNSIVRDFNYDLTIPSSLTSTIAIAAQNPDNPGDLNQVTFAAFNKGIRNRFITNTGINGKSKLKSKFYKFAAASQLQETNTGFSDAEIKVSYYNPIKLLDEVSKLNDHLIELRIYLDRLKGYKRIKDSRTARAREMGSTEDTNESGKEYSIIIDTDLVKQTKQHNQQQESYINSTPWELTGDSFVDFGEIPSSLINKARTVLKEIIRIKNNLSQYDFSATTLTSLENAGEVIGGFKVEDSNPQIKTPDITSIIPLKFNIKLDGISGIVIGNLFKLDKSRLPSSYNKSDVVFIVFGEEQTIDNQDWTTTITGQITLLK